MSSQSHTVLSLYNSSVWHDPHCSEFSGRFGYRVVTCCHHAYSWRNWMQAETQWLWPTPSIQI